MEALRKRHAFFHAMGCRLSDHGLEVMHAEDFKESDIRTIFRDVRNGYPLESDQIARFKSAMLYEFAVMNHDRVWTQQFHLGALRNNNSRAFKALGPDTGFDSMADGLLGRSLSRFLDRLEAEGRLTKSIFYNLNPSVNDLIATMIGNFQDGSCPGKMQYGSGWWFLDQKDGMERQLETLSNQGLLSCFVGMLTDSRSFLSYTRHEYFRRILCNLLGTEMEQGLLPNDLNLIGSMVQDICYGNASRYFGFDLQKKANRQA
jgi:glucuronate isomerase